eukprot:scaffold1001_cov188-Ochromonas_danica.AAC.2
MKIDYSLSEMYLRSYYSAIGFERCSWHVWDRAAAGLLITTIAAQFQGGSGSGQWVDRAVVLWIFQ